NTYGQRLSPNQLINRNLRRSPDPDRHANGANSAIYVKMPARLREQARDVRRNQPAGRQFRTDKLQRSLAPVGVTRHAEIDAQLRRAIERVGVVTEENVDPGAVDQRLDIAQNVGDARRRAEAAPALEIRADQIDRFVLNRDLDRFRPQDTDAALAEQPRDGIFHTAPGVVVAQAAVDPERRSQARKR